jgi:hypothetical protein
MLYLTNPTNLRVGLVISNPTNLKVLYKEKVPLRGTIIKRR